MDNGRCGLEAQPVEVQPADAERTPGPVLVQDATGRAVEALEISGPSGADFDVFNAIIRSQLSDGYTLRVLPTRYGLIVWTRSERPPPERPALQVSPTDTSALRIA